MNLHEFYVLMSCVTSYYNNDFSSVITNRSDLFDNDGQNVVARSTRNYSQKNKKQ